MSFILFFLKIPPPPRSTRTHTLCPYPTLFRSRRAGHRTLRPPGLRTAVAGLFRTRAARGFRPPYAAPAGRGVVLAPALRGDGFDAARVSGRAIEIGRAHV